MNLSKNSIKKIIFILCSVVLFYEILENLGAIAGTFDKTFALFFPFILGGAIAFVINVPMRQIEKHLFAKRTSAKANRLRRILALLLTMMVFLLVVSLAVGIVVPEVSRTVSDLAGKAPDAIDEGIKKLENLAEDYPEIKQKISDLEIDWGKTTSTIVSMLKNGAGTVVNSGIGIVSDVLGGIVTFFIALVFAIYILFQKEKLSSQIKQILYSFIKRDAADMIIKMGNVSSQTFANFLSGQFLEACILGSMFFITMTIIGLPYALMMGVLIAITALIPIVGAFLGCIIGAFLILIDSPVKALIFVAMFLVLQQLEGNLIYPHVVGSSVGLPSIWVLVAVTIGGKMMGILGMLIFIPICSILYALFREVVKKRLREKKVPEDLYK